MGSSATLIRFLIAGAFAISMFAGTVSAQESCATNKVVVRGDFGEARFTIELADEPAERAQGLMHRESMARSAGMLFVFEQPQAVAFWMKNTLIPLDMIFIDSTGRIAHIHENAIPLDETPIPGGEGIYAVLEINGGLSKTYGIRTGDALQHPVFSGGPAVIPCPE
ncbi:DUF192 domain-containing protein [Planktotalea sp.]|uniref:DUF192 domain-containing protein n=1 Tax=Planktotalea sp. TaxID=2029877 RepID=UPI003F6B3DB5